MEIIVIEFIDEISPMISGIFNVNVIKLKESKFSRTEDVSKGLKFLKEEDKDYYMNSNNQFEKIFIGLGEYIPSKNKLIIL